MDADRGGDSAQDRAKRYLGKSKEAHRMAENTLDPHMQATFEKIALDWKRLADHTLKHRP
jgi:hypothetical protein